MIIKWVIVFDKEKVIKVALKYFHKIKKFVSSKNDLKFLVQSYWLEVDEMFHPYRKDSSYLRAAMFKAYKEKCVYCGRTIQQRDMHIDHIIPSNQREKIDDEVRE